MTFYRKENYMDNLIKNLPGEIWKGIPNFEDKYQVSNLGRVKSLNYKRIGKPAIIEPSKTKYGYRLVIRKDKKQYTIWLDRIIYFLFHPEDANKDDKNTRVNRYLVAHKDGNKYNLSVDNLYLIPREEYNLLLAKKKDYYFRGKLIHVYKNDILYKDCKTLNDIQSLFPFEKEKIHELCDSQEKFSYEDDVYQFKVEKLKIKQESPIEERVKNLPGEIWKEYHSYWISNLGRVKSTRGKKHPYTYLLKQKETLYGYYSVTLTINNKAKEILVHRLVATLFLKKEDYHTQVNHKSGNTKDNSVDNLEWCTASENIRHAYKTGLIIPKSLQLLVIDTICYKVYFFSSITAAGKFFELSNLNYYIKEGKYKHFKLYKMDLWKQGLPMSDHIESLNIKNLPNEIWKDLPGFEGQYLISNLGRMINLNYNKSNKPVIMKYTKRKNGYIITLKKGSEWSSYFVARLVYFTFHPEDADKEDRTSMNKQYVITYKDNDRYNVKLDNLCLITRHESNLLISNRKDFYFRSKIVHVYKNGIFYKDCKNLNDMQTLFPFEKEKIHELCDSREKFIYEDNIYQFEVEKLKVEHASPIEERVEDLPGEIWKDFHDYQISNLGRVKSFKKSSHPYTYLLKQKTTKKGYYRVTLSIDKKPTDFLVHRLVARLFLEKKDEHTQVNHKDGNGLNNRVDNLEWCTASENIIHAYKTGLMIPTFKPILVVNIITHKTYFFNSIISISEFFNMSDSTIISYIKERKYKHYIFYKVPKELLK